MNLSRNFTLQELIKSDTAVRLDINNNPNSGQIEKLKALCENILQPVRDHFGRVKVSALENQDTSHTHEVGEHTHEQHGHTKILVNEKTIQILQTQIDELKAKSDNPLAQ